MISAIRDREVRSALGAACSSARTCGRSRLRRLRAPRTRIILADGIDHDQGGNVGPQLSRQLPLPSDPDGLPCSTRLARLW
jgi:hypothetical protein